MNPRKYVKKRESQLGDLDQLKLKTVALYSDRDEEIHVTQSVGFVAAESILVDLVSVS